MINSASWVDDSTDVSRQVLLTKSIKKWFIIRLIIDRMLLILSMRAHGLLIPALSFRVVCYDVRVYLRQQSRRAAWTGHQVMWSVSRWRFCLIVSTAWGSLFHGRHDILLITLVSWISCWVIHLIMDSNSTGQSHIIAMGGYLIVAEVEKTWSLLHLRMPSFIELPSSIMFPSERYKSPNWVNPKTKSTIKWIDARPTPRYTNNN